MHQSLLLLALAATVVGCKSAKTSHSTAHPVTETQFSWQKDAPAAEADNSRPTVLSVRPEFSLIELSAIEKRDPGVRLQLTKDGKSFVVEIIKGDERSIVVSILSGQSSIPALSAGDKLGLAVLAQ